MASVAPPLTATRPSAAPYLSIRDAARAIEFYKKAFGAREVMRLADGEKIGHAELAIGDSVIYLADEYPDYGFLSPQALGGSSVRIHLYVDDVDALAKQAVSAGAQVVRAVEDQFYGDRSGQVADPFGYTWILSTRKEEVSLEQMQRRFEAMAKKAEPPAPKVDPVRKGFRTLTPYLVAEDAAGVIDFLKHTFGAQEQLRAGPGSAGGLHCELRIGDSMIMIGGGGPGFAWHGTPKPGAFHIYVPDCDAIYQRALGEGGTSLDTPSDQSYGERTASVKDSAGNHWYIATSKGDNYKWEGAPDVQPYLHPLRAEPVINFLKRAFGAEELGRYTAPDGVIHHTTLKIGSSYLEMGEAQGVYQPMASMFYLYVPNVDALYRRALELGATSTSEPADQPYGDRTAAITDAFGNQWYIATHISESAP